MLLQNIADALLVDRVGIGMQQTHSNALNLRLPDALYERFDRGALERLKNLAAVIKPLRHSPAQTSGHQRRPAIGIKVVLVEAVLVTDLK